MGMCGRAVQSKSHYNLTHLGTIAKVGVPQMVAAVSNAGGLGILGARTVLNT